MTIIEDFELDDPSWADSKECILAEMHRVTKNLGKVAALIGETTADLEAEEARYRHWRSIFMASILDSNARTAEWKARVQAESEPAYAQSYEIISELRGRVAELEAVKAALLARKDVLCNAVSLFSAGAS